MRRPRPGDDNGDDHYGVRVDEPRRHLSSPLLPFSFSPPFSFFFFLLPFFSFLLSFLLFLLPPPPSYKPGHHHMNTIRDDALQTFSNFYHRICM